MSLDARKIVAVLTACLCAAGINLSSGHAQQSQKRIHEPVFRAAVHQEGMARTGVSSAAAIVPMQDGAASIPSGQQIPAAIAGPGAQPGFGVRPVGFDQPMGPNDSAEDSEERHPLDPAIHIARRGLDAIRTNIRDYSCYMVKRERINGKLSNKETLFVKIRNGRQDADQGAVPFSIYMRFVDPAPVKGREVIWIQGHNDNKMIAHDTGLKGLIRVNLEPTSRLAMTGNRYPIYEAGLENLVVKLIEKAERDRKAGDCKVEFFQGAEINDRKCTVIQVTHPDKRDPYDFHIAQVYIDNELQVPVRYAAYSWPTTPGGSPVLEEEYTYLNLKINVGLTDEDFNPDNPEYDYP